MRQRDGVKGKQLLATVKSIPVSSVAITELKCQEGLPEYGTSIKTNMVKPLGGRSSAPDLAGGAYSAPPDSPAGGGPITPPPLPAIRASNLVAFGHSFHSP